MLIKKAAIILFVLSALPARAQEPTPTPIEMDGYSFAAMGGGTVSMSSEADTKLAPMARLQVSGPLALGSADPTKLPALHVTADLEALPGETIDQGGGIGSTIAQFRALRFTVGISQRISKWQTFGEQRIATSIYADAGFATRLDGEVKARDRAPRFASFGVRFDEKTSGSYLKLGAGPDQRLDGRYGFVAHVDAYVRAYGLKSGTGEVGLVLRAILGVQSLADARAGVPSTRRDSINVGVLAGF